MTLALIFDSAGFGEWFILLAVVLIVVGPQKLPSTARKLGSFYARFRRAAEAFKRQLMDLENEATRAAREAERQVDEAFKSEGDESKAVPAAIDDVPSTPPPAPAPEPPKES